MAEYEGDIRQSIRIILGTDRGERVMRPDFGAGLNQFVFEPASSSTMNLLATRVTEALVAWEPRIDLLSVKVAVDQLEHNKLLVDMNFKVRVTNTQFNLVYPFYLQEGAAR